MLSIGCIGTQAQGIINGATAKRLKVKTATKQTIYNKQTQQTQTEVDTYDTNGRLILKESAMGDSTFDEHTYYTYNAQNKVVMYVVKHDYKDGFGADTATFSYNADGLENGHTYRYDGDEIKYRNRRVYFSNKNYISGVEEYAVSDSGKVWSVYSVNFNEKGDTIAIGGEWGTTYTYLPEYNTKGQLIKKTIKRINYGDPEYETRKYNAAGQLIEKKHSHIEYGDEIYTYGYNTNGLIEKIIYTERSKDRPEGELVHTTTYRYTFY